VAQATSVRRLIGLSGQYAAVDPFLTGRENLVMIGRLHGLGRRAAHCRAAELLDRLGLIEAADRQARTYSGGMRRRLDVAAGLIAAPLRYRHATTADRRPQRPKHGARNVPDA